MPARKKVLAVIASIAMMTGCAATDSTGTEQPIAVTPGVYQMQTVNGVALPANVSDGQSPIWVNSGALTLNADHTYSISVSYQRLIGDTWTPINDSCSGSYELTSKSIEFQELGSCNGAYAATVKDGVVTAWLVPNLKVEYKL